MPNPTHTFIIKHRDHYGSVGTIQIRIDADTAARLRRYAVLRTNGPSDPSNDAEIGRRIVERGLEATGVYVMEEKR